MIEQPELNHKKGEVKSTEQEPGTTLAQDIRYLLLKVFMIILCFIVLFAFVFGIFRNPDAAMAPAVKNGDLVLFYRFDKQYITGDAVVIRKNDQYQVLRVVAVSGDTVDITAQGLMINGSLQYESEIYEDTYPYVDGISFPVTLGDDQVFLLADARGSGTDSRVFGAVDIKDISGKVMLIVRRRSV